MKYLSERNIKKHGLKNSCSWLAKMVKIRLVFKVMRKRNL